MDLLKIAIMQPYFFPYIGYWQLMNAVEKYVIYDNIQYEKGSWINRNRILVNGCDKYITIPLKHDSDYNDIRERWLSDPFKKTQQKILNQIINAYRRAPQFETAFPVIKKAVEYDEPNLFNYVYHSNVIVAAYLDIRTPLIISSSIAVDSSLKSADRVIATCKALDAAEYINAIGGQALYQYDSFKKHGIDLKFLKPDLAAYRQFDNPFIPSLSIIDVMMFNTKEQIQEMLQQFTILQQTTPFD